MLEAKPAPLDGPLTEGGLYRLLSWMSPSFPVGAYTYSHGIEYAIEAGLIKDAKDLAVWIEGVVSFGAGRVDADFFRDAWRAVDAGDDDALARTVEGADALRGSKETALESTAQGEAFMQTVRAVWPHARMEEWTDVLRVLDRPPPYAVAVGVAAAVSGLALKSTLIAFLHAFSANLVSAAVRLVPLGQTDGQKTLAALQPVVLDAALASLERSGEDLGSAAPIVEWTSMKHETQYTRLFRS